MKCEGMKLIYPILSGGWNSRGWNMGVGDEIRGDEIWEGGEEIRGDEI